MQLAAAAMAMHSPSLPALRQTCLCDCYQGFGVCGRPFCEGDVQEMHGMDFLVWGEFTSLDCLASGSSFPDAQMDLPSVWPTQVWLS